MIRAGNYIETAAAMAGIGKTALYNWLKRGAKERNRLEKDSRARIRQREAPFLDFVNAVEKAQAHAEVVDVAAISAGARASWQAAAWRLERKFPARWGRRDHLKVVMEKEVDSFISDLKAALDPATFQVVTDAIANFVGPRTDGPGSEEGRSAPDGGDPQMEPEL
jgi:hypothetical protein